MSIPRAIYYSAMKRNILLIQLGWISRELCPMKRASPQRLQTVWFHFCNIFESTKLQRWRRNLWLPVIRDGGWKVMRVILNIRKGQYLECGVAYKVIQWPILSSSLQEDKIVQSLIFVVQSLSRVWLFVIPWTAACQVSLSFSISRVCSKSRPLSWWIHTQWIQGKRRESEQDQWVVSMSVAG